MWEVKSEKILAQSEKRETVLSKKSELLSATDFCFMFVQSLLKTTKKKCLQLYSSVYIQATQNLQKT